MSLCPSLLRLLRFPSPLTGHRESAVDYLSPAVLRGSVLTPPHDLTPKRRAGIAPITSEQNRNLDFILCVGAGVCVCAPTRVLGEVVEAELCHYFLVHVPVHTRGYVVCEDPPDLLTTHTHAQTPHVQHHSTAHTPLFGLLHKLRSLQRVHAQEVRINVRGFTICLLGITVLFL